MFILILLLLCQPAFAEGDPRLDLLWQMATKQENDELLANTVKTVEVLNREFDLNTEALAFIHSVRAAVLPVSGFDFFTSSKELVQLTALYLEAKKEWGASVSGRKKFKRDIGTSTEREEEGDFYDFFPEFCSQRIIISGKGYSSDYYRDKYQLDHARKRFVMP